ncbi:MAG TPA: MqnA/MqnD/SBP family protein [Candidatus Acidoferrales bacterium]|jgi:1,4-dihydroxy-6-naphthoate synthase|nr:MqnA/MqnD/SBP family protein [Candidatus Acidoferrales bacterium]
MTLATPQEIVSAHSPDSDDAFMFYGLATKKVRSTKVTFRHVLEDIETLNRKAMEGRYDLSAISYHAYPYVSDKYVLMNSGSSIGDGYGPMIVSSRPMDPDDLKGKRIAVPGTMTTAYLSMKLYQPDFEAVITPFDKITEAVKERAVDAGLIIHEAQLTFEREGFHRVVDLGRWFKNAYGLPLPLGGNVLLRSLSREIQVECCRMMRESIQFALDNHGAALEYALQFARDLEPRLAEKFVGMYVNHYTLDAGSVVPKAAQKLLDLGFEAGLIPKRVEVEFIG